MPPKYIFLTGAPDCDALTWESEVLYGTLLPQVTRYLEGRMIHDGHVNTPKDIPTSGLRPAWRSIPLNRQHLPTGMSQSRAHLAAGRAPIYFEEQVHLMQHGTDTSFFTTTSVSFSSDTPGAEPELELASSAETNEEILSQFYEHSFAVHEGMQSSQIALPPKPGSQDSQPDTSNITHSSFYSTDSDSTTFFSSSSEATHYHNMQPSLIPHSGPITNLKSIPNACYLSSINPQTMTVNLLVGLISIAPPRTIKTRRGGREVEIVEMLVGDETKAGFSINFWLQPTPLPVSNPRQPVVDKDKDLRQKLCQLRPQDIILVRNAALSSFQKKVFAQSLRKNMTKLDLMFRNIIDEQDEPGAYSTTHLSQEEECLDAQAVKAKKVREWVTQFVGPAVKPRSRTAAGKELPPDTQ